jgi:hypothetical protein
VLVFDEFHGYEGWEQHEAKAFEEWCERHSVWVDKIIEGREEAAFVVVQIGSK